MKDFSRLKSVSDVNIKLLDYQQQALYYERFLTSLPPAELKNAPIRQRASLLKFMARKTEVFFIGICLLIILVLLFAVLMTGGPDLRLLFLILPVAAGVLTLMYTNKLRGYLSNLYNSSEIKLEHRFENKMGKYSDYLAQRDRLTREYEATVMDEKTASDIIDACITARGLIQIKSQSGINEDELLVFRYIKYPTGGVEKTLDGVVLCQRYKVQYIALTKCELCEISGVYDMFEDILQGSGASSCLLEDIDKVDLRSNDIYATQFYCVVADSKDTMFLPSKSILPLKMYTITSYCWTKADSSATGADYITRTRRELDKKKNTELEYDDFDKIRSLAYTAGASDVAFSVSDGCEEEHKQNFEKVHTLVERSLNVMIQEKKMQ